jgi:opacity protein-like surface antigen
MKKILITGILALFLAGHASAQSYATGTSSPAGAWSNLWGLSWEISIPTNNDFLTKTSFAGGKFEYRHFFPGKPLSLGVSLGWNSYEQYIPTQTITYDEGSKAITTDMDRVIYTVPVAAIGHYYFNYGKMAMPYLGVGIGAQYSEQDIYYNIFLDEEYNWGFLVRPEIGVLIAPGQKNWGILAGASYSFATNKNESFNIDNLKNFSFNIGLFLAY